MKYINPINTDKIKESFLDPKKPYRYVVIDNFFNTEICNKFEKSYPKQNDKRTGLHNALEDCKYQAQKVQKVYRQLGIK